MNTRIYPQNHSLETTIDYMSSLYRELSERTLDKELVALLNTWECYLDTLLLQTAEVSTDYKTSILANKLLYSNSLHRSAEQTHTTQLNLG